MNRIFLRVYLGILVAIVVSIISGSLILWYSMKRSFDQAPPTMTYSIGQMGDLIMESLPPEKAQEVLTTLREQRRVPTEVIEPDDPRLSKKARGLIAQGKPGWGLDWKFDDGSTASGSMSFIPLQSGKVLAFGPQTPPHPDATSWFLVSLALIFVVTVTAIVLSRPIVSQLRNLENAAKRIAGGDLSARSGVNPGGSVGPLAKTFDWMADRNQELLENQRQLVQAVAHELRTPISRIRFGLEIARMEYEGGEPERRGEDIVLELEELDGMVEELLVFSRYDVGSARLSAVRLDILDAMERQIDRLAPLHPEVKIEIAEDCRSCSREVSLDQRSFERVVRNLLANAVRYAETVVETKWKITDDELVFAVLDDGPGIPENQRKRVLEPFVRLDESRSRTSGGAGLGLAIVERILKANGGRVEIGTSAKGGAAVETRWPLLDAPS